MCTGLSESRLSTGPRPESGTETASSHWSSPDPAGTERLGFRLYRGCVVNRVVKTPLRRVFSESPEITGTV